VGEAAEGECGELRHGGDARSCGRYGVNRVVMQG
jgi:hypothetical protein